MENVECFASVRLLAGIIVSEITHDVENRTLKPTQLSLYVNHCMQAPQITLATYDFCSGSIVKHSINAQSFE